MDAGGGSCLSYQGLLGQGLEFVVAVLSVCWKEHTEQLHLTTSPPKAQRGLKTKGSSGLSGPYLGMGSV